MKNLRNTSIIILATLFSVTSCSTDDGFDPISEDPFTPPTAAAFKALQEDAFNNLKQNATFNAEDGITFESDAGVTLSIFGDCLTLNGDQVSGAVDLEFVEIFDRGNMLTTNATTVGKNEDDNLEQLISGGEFNIKAYQNGEELEFDESCGMMIKVPVSLTGGEVDGMGPFTGEMDQDGNLVWLEQNTEFWVDQEGESPTYNAFLDSFQWFNCDVFSYDPDPKTEIGISVPQGFDSSNSSVYLARSGQPNSLGFIYGEFPIGLEAHIIFLSEHEGEFRYAIQSVTVASGQEVTFTLEETSIAPVEDLTQIINDLP
ncbi:hypothetical protein OOZ15_10335 [Galbibacter sp. EGI 63066]|uniref:hypothetical protein n=1 Tax=Galbibacter sp. EGI 63066 TaxID=2993559 RepID=UPI0022493E9B|nr:hypothetical protein [Galbibacter sp. EGI 63066]MCX2680338.1 hypothetical protein [Galbibacter sp. EGI 63066]